MGLPKLTRALCCAQVQIYLRQRQDSLQGALRQHASVAGMLVCWQICMDVPQIVVFV